MVGGEIMVSDDQYRIEGSAENWENGKLGLNPECAQPVSKEVEQGLDKDLDIVLVELRLPTMLHAMLKAQAKAEGKGFNFFLRETLEARLRN